MRKLDALTSPSVDRRDDEVVVKIGSTEITRRQMIEDLDSEHVTDFLRSARTLTRALKNYKSVKDAARSLTENDMFELPRIGELAVLLFGLVLVHEGEDARKWLGDDRKLSTRHAKAKAKKRKKRPSRHKYTGNVVRFGRRG